MDKRFLLIFIMMASLVLLTDAQIFRLPPNVGKPRPPGPVLPSCVCIRDKPCPCSGSGKPYILIHN